MDEAVAKEVRFFITHSLLNLTSFKGSDCIRLPVP